MDSLTKTILYQGSHFLPTVEHSSLDKVAARINKNHINPISAIALEIMVILKDALSQYRKSKKCINDYYDITSHEADIYFQGFSIPLTILINACSKNQDDVERIVNSLPEPACILSTQMSQNEYIIDTIGLFYQNLSECTSSNYMAAVSQVFAYCQTELLSENKYYLLGVIAAETVFRDFYTRIDLTPKAFS